MSKVKNPKEKKELSLKKDRRNTYGESPHAARKSIPQNKARQHREERHAANQILREAKYASADEQIAKVENNIKAKTKKKRLKGFKKYPDTPLGEVIKQKIKRRKEDEGE